MIMSEAFVILNYSRIIKAVQYNSENDSWTTWLSTLKKDIPKVSKDAKYLFKELDSGKLKVTDWQGYCNSVKMTDETLISFLRDTKYGTKDLASYQQYLKESSQSMTLFQRAGKAAGGVIKSLGATLGSMATVWAFEEVFSLVFTVIDNAVHKVEYAQERLEDFNSSMKETKDTLKSQQDWITENGETYSKLAKGVDDYGHNVSLTTDEFKQYNDITSQIAEMFPDMVQGYNDQNEAIIKNKGNVEALTKAYKESAKAKYADIMTKSSSTYSDYHDAISEAQDQKERITSFMNAKEIRGFATSNGSYQMRVGNEYYYEMFKDLLSEEDNSKLNEEIRNLISKRATAGSNNATFTFDDLSSQLQSKIRSALITANTTVSTETAKVKPLLEAYIYGDSNSDYDKLSEQGQQAIRNVITNLDEEFYSQFSSDNDMFSYFQSNFIEPLKGAINGNELAIEINTLFELDKSKYKNYAEYIAAVEEKIKDLKNAKDENGNPIFTDEQLNQLRKSKGVADVDSDGNVSGTALINKTKEKYKDVKGAESYIGTLTEDEIRYIEGLEQEIKTVEEIKNAVEGLDKKTNTKAKETKKSFSSIWDALKDSEQKSLQKSVLDGTFTEDSIKDFSDLQDMADKFSLEKVRKEILDTISLEDSLSQFLDDTGKLTSAFQEMQKSDNHVVSTKTLLGMPDAIRKLKGYTDFRNTVTDPNVSKADKKGAFEDLISEYLKYYNSIKKITPETKNEVINALKDVGVVNAEELANAQLAANISFKKVKSEAKDMTDFVINMTDEDYKNFIDACNKKGIKNTNLFNKIGNDTALLITNLDSKYKSDVKNYLNSLESKLKAEKSYAETLVKLREIEWNSSETTSNQQNPSWFGGTAGGKLPQKGTKEYEEYQKAKAKYLKIKKQLDKAEKENKKNLAKLKADLAEQGAKLNLEYDPSDPSSNKNKNKSSSTGSKTVNQIDWIERKITTLTKKLDILKTKYDATFNNSKINSSTKLLNAQSKNIDKQLKILEKQESTYAKAAPKYKGIANTYFKKVGSKYTDLVKNGGYTIEDFTTSDTTKSTKKNKSKKKQVKVTKKQYDAIQKAIEYWDKGLEAEQNQIATATEIKTIKQNRLQDRQEFQDTVAAKWSAKQQYGSLSERKHAMDKEWEWQKKSYETQMASAKLDKDTAKVEQLKAEMANAEVDYKVKKLQADQEDKETLLSQLQTEEELGALRDANGSVDKQIDVTRESYQLQIKIAKAQCNTAEAAKLEKEEQKAIVDLQKKKFDNIKSYYDAVTTLTDNDQKDIQNQMDILEARGITVTVDYYKGLNQLEAGKQSQYKEELVKLQAELDKLTKGTQAWYDAQNEIQNVQDSLASSEKAVVDNTNALREATDKLYEKAYSYADNIIAESDFLTGLVRGDDTDQDTGKLTDAGMAKLYNAIFSKEVNDANINLAKSRVTAIQDIVDRYKDGSISLEKAEEEAKKMNFTSYEQMADALPDLRSKYQEYINNSNGYLDTIVDLVKSGMDEMKNHLSDMVDAHKEAMNKEKELYDYQKNILEKTKTINDIQKQISAVRGDDSEEGRLRLSQLQSQLDDAKSDLQDTEYDKYISDQEEMLDNMLDEYEDIMTTLQKDENYLIEQGYKLVNGSIGKIKEVINENASRWEYTPSPDYTKEVAKTNEQSPFEFDYSKIPNGTSSITSSILAAQTAIVESINKIGGLNGEAEKPKTDNTSGNGDGIGGDNGVSDVSDSELKEANKEAEANHQSRADSWQGSNSNGASEGYASQARRIAQEESLKSILSRSSGKGDISKPLRPVKSGETFSSALNQKLSQYGYVVKTGKGSGGADYIKMFAIALGLAGSDGSYGKNGNVYQALADKYNLCGFRTGGIADIRPPKGEDGIAWVRNKEGFVAPENVEDIRKLFDVLPDVTSFMENSFIKPNLPTTVNNDLGNSYDIKIGDINMEGVNDPDAFAKQLVKAVQNKSNVQRALRGVTTEQILGRSKLGVNRVI